MDVRCDSSINIHIKVKENSQICSWLPSLTRPSPPRPTRDVDECGERLKLLLKENDIIKTWLTAPLGATEERHLMSVFR